MKSLKFATAVSAVFLSQLTPTASWAAAEHDDKHHAGKPAAADAGADTAADAEVRKVDKETKKITLKHGEIKSLDMPAMTMVFQVKEPALLDKIKAGDKVRFKAEKVAGGYAITAIEVAK